MSEDEAEDLFRSAMTEMRAAFDHFDRDGDGLLGERDLADALAGLGQPAPLEEIRRLIASVDVGHLGRLDFAAFVRLLEPLPEGLDPEADAREAFALLDVDGDGYLSAADLRRAARRAGQADEGEVRDMLSAADVDGDGRISFAEFRRWY